MEKHVRCYKCHEALDYEQQSFCPHCGAFRKKCDYCAKFIDPDTAICPYCNYQYTTNLNAEKPFFSDRLSNTLKWITLLISIVFFVLAFMDMMSYPTKYSFYLLACFFFLILFFLLYKFDRPK